jgi:signal transduction histidine kinase
LSLSSIIFNHFGKGEPLETINDISEHYDDFLSSNQTFKNDIVFYNTIINGIQKNEHPIPQLKRRKEINIYNEESSFQIRLIYLLIYLVIHNKLYLAEKVYRKLIPIMQTTKMGITHSDYLFYAGILNYKLFLKNKKRRHKSHLKKLLKELLLFASTMPENFSSKAQLLNACYGHLKNPGKNPIRLFEKANREAKSNEFLQVQIFALEFIAEIYASQQSLNVANIYYSQAIEVAKAWGSDVKVAQLEAHISKLEKTAFLDASSVFETQDKQSQLFDLYSLVNFSQTISQEIEIENLLKKIVKITTENANAEKGAYIQVKNGQPYILASFDTAHKDPELFLNSKKSNFKLPLSVINYTANTKALTLSGSAQKDKFLQKDPVIINGKIKSVIAVPVKASGNMLGILYFENNHFENAFNKNHIQTLELLATQAAISLQNAYLYQENKDLIENLEHRVEGQVNEIKVATEAKERSQNIAKKLAEQASHATLTRGIAHEIRNPLGLLLSGTEMILDSLDDPKSIEEYCEVVKSSILRLRSITTTMLNYGSSTEAHHKAKTNVNKLINDVKVVAIGECKKRRITMEVTLDESIPEIVINPNRINQAILNLVVNAIEAVNSNGNITLKTSHTQNTTLDNNVVMGIQIEVNDTGPGIDSENIEKIFDPFFTTKYENIGLGLSTVVNTLNEHNGRAWAHSDTVHGTSIFLWVPIIGD